MAFQIPGLRFRTRFFLVAMIPVVLASLALDVVLGRVGEDETAAEARGSLDHLVTLGERLAVDVDPSDPPQGGRFVRNLAASGARATLIATDGRVLAESDVAADALGTMPNHGDRPEVIDSLANGSGSAVRYSRTLGASLMYVARRVETRAGPAVLRLALPIRQLDDQNQARRQRLLVTMLAALLVTAAGVWAASVMLSRRVGRLAAAAQRMAEGDFDVAVDDPSRDELSVLARSLATLARANRVALARLAAEGRLVRTIIDAMREGVVAVDAAGRITLVNRAMLALAGHAGDAVGQTPAELLRSPEILDAIARALRGEAVTTEAQVAHPRAASLLIDAAPIPDAGGAVAVVHDTSELRRVDQVRRDFVANVSHELRNPVATVQAAAETLVLLAEGEVDEDRRRLVETIARQAGRMGSLIRDLLDLARLDAGQYRIDRHPVDPAPILAAAVEAVEGRARERSLTVQAQPVPDGLRCLCDPSALATVLSNLLDNAVKYTRPGDRIDLRVRAAGNAVELDVADSGPGIDEAHLPRLFERFYRVDAGRSRDLGGTGLGLAIVKHLVLAMDGSVRVRSTLGQGTTFTIVLPSAPA